MRMSLLALVGVAVLTLAGNAVAEELAAPLKPLSFFVGRWQGGGDVHDTGGKGAGTSTITVEANGGALLRRDHTELTDKAGKPTGGFDQIMLIYPDAGGLHAEYSDGEHLIHYTSAVVAGASVEFVSAPTPGAPVFHLRYDAVDAVRLKVSFGMVPPGGSTVMPIATGELHRVK